MWHLEYYMTSIEMLTHAVDTIEATSHMIEYCAESFPLSHVLLSMNGNFIITQACSYRMSTFPTVNLKNNRDEVLDPLLKLVFFII